ncbi:MAG: hypothetical protein ACRBI6_18605 [Acidimicrobiales bacterium]
MDEKDLKKATPSQRSVPRVVESDDELTPAALAALRRRSDDELHALAERANRRG